MMTFADLGIELPRGPSGPEIQTTCPKCSAERRKKSAKCLSVNIEKGCWLCHHCGWTGALGRDDEEARKPRHSGRPQYRRPDPRPRIALPQNALDWFHARGITDGVLARNRVDFGRAYFPQLEDHAEAVIFPYFRGGEEINRKYRTIDEKNFRLETGCELALYGLDDVERDQLVWVEGELDKLAFEVAGFRSVVSVPNGAPPPNAKNYSALLAFLGADHEKLDAVQHHVLAVDADSPGRLLEAELARRLGPEKCSRVRWPEGCKDANDVVMKHGAEELRWYLEHAEPFPIEGAFEIHDRRDDILSLYESGMKPGVSSGWPELDKLYTVRPGEVTVVTGIPSSGKSNVIDALTVNLARHHDWRIAVFSPENLPLEQHMAAIVEKYVGKPFREGPTHRMTLSELERGMAWVAEHFFWIMPSSERDWTAEKILETAGRLCMGRGIRALVIDPWNELEALRPSGMSETEYISHTLKRIRVFARNRGVHVWIVVHPAKLYRDDKGRYPVPTLYDCSGSAHWRNKTDNGLVVWRDLSSEDRDEVEIHVQKVRFRHVGRRGKVQLYYERACATYRGERIASESPSGFHNGPAHTSRKPLPKAGSGGSVR